MKMSKLLVVMFVGVVVTAFVSSGCNWFKDDAGPSEPSAVEDTVGELPAFEAPEEGAPEAPVVTPEVTPETTPESTPGPSVEPFSAEDASIKLMNPNGEEVRWDSKCIHPRAWIKVVHSGELPDDFIRVEQGGSKQELIYKKIEGGTEVHMNRMNNLKTYIVHNARDLQPNEFKVNAAGDINCDGYGDFVVGAPNKTVGFKMRAGYAHVFYGNDALNYGDWVSNAEHSRIIGNTSGGRIGSSSALGDVNGDGLADIAVVAKGEAKGCVYLFHGARSVPDELNARVNGGNQNARICLTLGTKVGFDSVTLGDLNGDGFDDLLVGSAMASGPKNNDALLLNSGVVYGFFGGQDGIKGMMIDQDTNADIEFTTSTAFRHLGVSLLIADVNGDGYDDAIMGATGSDADPVPCVGGKVFIKLGSEEMSAQGNYTVEELGNEMILGGRGCYADDTDIFGYSLAAHPGSDHAEELIIGARGNVYTYSFGSAPQALYPSSTESTIANIVGWSGKELLMGMITADKVQMGQTIRNILWLPDHQMRSVRMDDTNLGCSIANTDLNADGISEYIVGANEFDGGRGAVWIDLDNSHQNKQIRGYANSRFGTSIGVARPR
jgi:hypothetical protein